MEEEEDFLKEALEAERLQNLEFISKLPTEDTKKKISEALKVANIL